jgi:2-haloacid dehalogenase
MAESGGATKPQIRVFASKRDTVSCRPQDVLHVSSSVRFDAKRAHDAGTTQKLWVNRGLQPANRCSGNTVSRDISGLPEIEGP